MLPTPSLLTTKHLANTKIHSAGALDHTYQCCNHTQSYQTKKKGHKANYSCRSSVQGR